jgi:hypothetical protein
MSNATNYMTTTSMAGANHHDNSAPSSSNDLIESKFNQLARKILDELRHSNYSHDFFQAIDVILNEPASLSQPDAAARRAANQARRQQRIKRLKETNPAKTTTTTPNGAAGQEHGPEKGLADDIGLELKRQCELIMEKQKQQQEQLDNHQQILFDTQYRSLPAEITEAVAGHEQRRAGAKASSQKTSVGGGGADGGAFKESSSSSSSSAPRDKTGDIAGVQAFGKQQQAFSRLQQQQQSSNKTNNTKTARTTSKSKENLESRRDDGPAAHPINELASAKDQKHKSAIPQSTILSGINQRLDGAAGGAYPISKSATVATSGVSSSLSPNGASQLGKGLVRQASLRLNKQTSEAQRQFIQQQTRPLAASEKLKQRRPTRANVLEQPLTDDSDDDLDDDDDDDDDEHEFNYQSLASRRAHLNQKFVQQQQHQEQTSSATKTGEHAATMAPGGQQQAAASRSRHQVVSTIQSGIKQAPVNTANMTVAKQKQRFSSGAQVVRSSTLGAGQMTRPASGGARRQLASTQSNDNDEDNKHDNNEPRSLGGLLTSNDIGHFYKPHMNYSTSLLGNHRLSDDDEIIIIPTSQSPSSLMSASVSPVGHPQHQQHQQLEPGKQGSDANNIDEFSERFSISRTKSFWEKLANSKSGTADDAAKGGLVPSPQHDKQYFNSSQRSLASGPNLVADTKSSQCSLLNQSGQSADGRPANNGHGQHQHHHYPAAMKGAFDRMDSTGGSGNSHYSGCSSSSSTSGDEQTGQLNLAERRAMLVSAATGGNKPVVDVGHRRPAAANASMNPTINQLVQQDQLNRSDRFRQTR